MVTGLVSPAECEVKRPMRPLDEMGSSLGDPIIRLPGKACPARTAAQASRQAPLTSWPPPQHQEIATMLHRER
jgi:hypothetical protein